MALVTVQRSPTPSINEEDDVSLDVRLEGVDTLSEICRCSSGTPGSQKSLRSLHSRQKSLGEFYFAVKGAAVILPQNECIMMPRQASSTGGEIQLHLQAMLHLLRSQDTLKMAVRLESLLGNHTRYMAIVSTTGRQDNRESILLGIDYVSPDNTTIGLVLPIWASTYIALDGDGGIAIESATGGSQHVFKPMSVQAMWSAYQSLHKEKTVAELYPYFPGGLTHTWVTFYASQITSKEAFRSEWHYAYNDDTDLKAPSIDRYKDKPPEKAAAERMIRCTLKDIMQSVDLDEVTSKDIRQRLEERLNLNLSEFKEFIDHEMLIILGQMDKPSKIFDYLYLGTEWNASNWDELRQNNVGHILNVTKEVDNFFPGLFYYMKIRVSDEESSELLKHWDLTFKFIAEAKEKKSAVLVHCKKGISRSSSTVIAYAMKAYNWPLEKALNYVKEKRNCITPNKGFMEQLRTYQGILEASQHRNSALFNQLHFIPPAPELIPWDGLTEADGESDKKDDGKVVITDKPDSSQQASPAPRLLVASENILKSGPSHLDTTKSPARPTAEMITECVDEIDNDRPSLFQPTTCYASSSPLALCKSAVVQTGLVSNMTQKFEPSCVKPTRTDADEASADFRDDDVVQMLSLSLSTDVEEKRKRSIDEEYMPDLIERLPVRSFRRNVERKGEDSIKLKDVQYMLMKPRRKSSNSLASDSSSLSSGDESDLSGSGGSGSGGGGRFAKQRRNSKSSSGDSAVADLTAGTDSSSKDATGEPLVMARSCPATAGNGGVSMTSSMAAANRVEILPLDPSAKTVTFRRPLSFSEASANCPVVVPVGQVKRVTRQYETFSQNLSSAACAVAAQPSASKMTSNRRSSPALTSFNESDDDDDWPRRGVEAELRRRTREELKMVQQTRKHQSVSLPATTPVASTNDDLPPTGKKPSRKLFDRFFRKEVASPPSAAATPPPPKLKPSVKIWYHEVCKRAEKSYRKPNKPPAPPPRSANRGADDSPTPVDDDSVLNKVSLKVAQPGKVKHQKEQIERLSGVAVCSASAPSSSSVPTKMVKNRPDAEAGFSDKRSAPAKRGSFNSEADEKRADADNSVKLVRSLVDVFEVNNCLSPAVASERTADAFSPYLSAPSPWRRNSGLDTSSSASSLNCSGNHGNDIRRVGSFNSSIGWRHVGNPLGSDGRHFRSKSLNRHSVANNFYS